MAIPGFAFKSEKCTDKRLFTFLHTFFQGDKQKLTSSASFPPPRCQFSEAFRLSLNKFETPSHALAVAGSAFAESR